ncbi:YecA family protein, partial [Allorhizobium pseudoryzae]
LAEMISMAFPKPSPDLLKDAWRAIPFAVEQIYAHCKPMRYNPAAPANDP